MPNKVPAGGGGPSQASQIAAATGVSEQQAQAAIDKANAQLGAVYAGTHPADLSSKVMELLGLNPDGTPTAPPDTAGVPHTPSSGSGGRGGVSAAQQKAAAEASFNAILRAWGLQPSPELQSLVSKAAASKWTTTQFQMALRGTEDYAKQFPGIQWRTGMSEATYNSQYAAYKASARDAGYVLQRNAFGHVLKKGIDSREWQLRVAAIKQIDANRALFTDFQEELRRRGVLKPNEKMDNKDLYKFVTGRGSEAWTAVWNAASVTSGLESIGFEVGKGGDIGRKELLKMLKVPESKVQAGELVNIDYAQLAATASKALPASRLYGMGITKKDLVKMALGGKGASDVASRVQQAINTAEATASEQRVNPALSRQGMAGMPGAERLQATE